MDPFDIVIGANIYGLLLLDGVTQSGLNNLVAQNSQLGWILSGCLDSQYQPSEIKVQITTLDQINETLRNFWELENIPSRKILSPEEQFCEEHFLATHSRTPEGRYIVRLPFRNGPPDDIGDSRTTALSSLVRLENRLKKDQSKFQAYSDFLQEYLALGHMQGTPSSENSPNSYYIPHHAVFRNESTTTKLRVVFNASQVTSNGKSLNEYLLPGGKLQTDLSALILRWRQYKYVYTADIAKMFRQILIHPDDANYQKILWRAQPSDSVKEYKLLTVTYGTTSAPYLALRVLQQLTKDEGSQFPAAVPIINYQTYVDDCIFGADTKSKVLEMKNQLDAMLLRGGFKLRKWASNNQSLLSHIDSEDHGLALKDFESPDSLKILGIVWNPNTDAFQIKISTSSFTSVTKRTILSATAKLFDPLGWITPVIISAKILLQHLWKIHCDWDDNLPQDLVTKWQQFHSQLIVLEKLKIPRWTLYGPQIKGMELHGFCDASTKAYAAVVYLRIITNNDEVVTSLLIAKSKVAPLKTISVPRLELCAAYLLTKLIQFVQSSLLIQTIHGYCWTDSMITLEWIKQTPSRWKPFIANRVTKIQELDSIVQWRHVSTSDNPADCASRGLSPENLSQHQLWWSGPSWLRQPQSEWPLSSTHEKISEDMEERLSYATLALNVEVSWDLQHKFSSFIKLQKVTAYCLRFIRRLRRQYLPEDQHPFLNQQDLQRAKLFWLKQIQKESFLQEILSLKRTKTVDRSSSLSKLLPYLDSDGLLRVRGRLQHSSLTESEKHPIILKAHPLIKSLILHTHLKLLHGGSQSVLAQLRQQYWILRARTLIRSVLYNCVQCTRYRAQPTDQLMGALPACRVTPSTRAFQHTGVDYAGPITIKYAPGRGSKGHKAYISLFICMTTKAVHIELVSDYSTTTFIAAYHRFISRRGIPSDIYSDRGTNFQGANRELSAIFKTAIRNPDFINQIASDGVSWHFNPPAAPHFGGLWEVAVKSVKYHLHRCVGSLILTFEEMSTLLYRIEACLNSRPIVALSDNLDDYSYLSPGHFLIGTSLTTLPEPSVLQIKENRLSRWQLVQRVVEHFWKVWQQNYLQTLQQRPKWRIINKLIKPGKLVLLKTTGLPPSQWALGRIIKCHPGADGIVRVVTIRTSTSEFKRPIVKICLLPVDINEEVSSEPSTAGGT